MHIVTQKQATKAALRQGGTFDMSIWLTESAELRQRSQRS